MILNMHTKYNKYWGSIENLNDFTCFAVSLDPQMKSIFLPAIIKKMIENMRTEENILLDSNIKLKTICDVSNEFLDPILMGQGDTSATVENELRRYLNEPRMTFDKKFRLLDWWEKNALRFPIVARMAKVTNVASESGFSTCGRILDEYRIRLNTPIVEALVYTHNWILTML
uniref:HAT C-terminal dimerisation domain-containing protein n=1 Tax=Lactuca sativa TaxID=4236 RepID=A0A9R1UKG6_LACSA|nr:hypothetical protein LSAT_V11C900469070 [Lactuca sativa]